MLRQSLLEDFTSVDGFPHMLQFLLPTDLTTATLTQSSLKPSMLQSQQSLIRPIMSTLILVTSKICQLMS